MYNVLWFIVPLGAEQKSRSINWRELYAIVVAVDTCGSKLTSKQLLIHCDNMAVCHILKSGTSKNIQIMTQVRLLFYYCAQYNCVNCVCSSEYISTHDNTLADSLSRLQLSKFRTLAPGANTTMTVPYPVYDILSNSLHRYAYFCTNSLKILTLTFLHIFIYMCLLHMYLSCYCYCKMSNLILH